MNMEERQKIMQGDKPKSELELLKEENELLKSELLNTEKAAYLKGREDMVIISTFAHERDLRDSGHSENIILLDKARFKKTLNHYIEAFDVGYLAMKGM